MTEGLRVGRSLVIPEGELDWRFSPSSGPGGQHANRAHTRAEVIFDVEASGALSSRQRRRLLEQVGPQVSAVADEERSQARNRQIARDRLADKLAEALRPRKRRVPTRPSRRAQRRRVESKRRHSRKKRLRGKPRRDD